MTVSPSGTSVSDAPRRLHPLTLLFEIGKDLRQAAIPLVAVIFFSRSGTDELRLVAPLVLVAVTAACDDTPAAGFDRHLLKPVDPGRLVAVVNALANGRPGENGRGQTTDTPARPAVAGPPVMAR